MLTNRLGALHPQNTDDTCTHASRGNRLEMSQNAQRYNWSAAVVDERLHAIMQDIHENCVKHGRRDDGSINYVDGANIAGFVKVADAMLAQGVY